MTTVWALTQLTTRLQSDLQTEAPSTGRWSIVTIEDTGFFSPTFGKFSPRNFFKNASTCPQKVSPMNVHSSFIQEAGTWNNPSARQQWNRKTTCGVSVQGNTARCGVVGGEPLTLATTWTLNTKLDPAQRQADARGSTL